MKKLSSNFDATKPLVNKKRTQFTKPSKKSLFEAIKYLLKLTNQIGTLFRPRGLLHVNHLLQITIEKGITDINLSQFSQKSQSQAKHHMYGSWFYNETKSLIKVYIFLLQISQGNQPTFLFVKETRTEQLDSKNPLATNCIMIYR